MRIAQVEGSSVRSVNFESKTENPHFEGLFDVSPDELCQKQAEVKLIDVRQPEEYTGELGHIAGAELIVLDTLPDRIEELPKDQTIVFVCRSGARSARAAAFAAMNGFSNVYNMQGGMIQWNQLQLPVER